MNAGLIYLLAKGPTVLLRRTQRRFTGARGALMLVGIAVVVMLMLGPQLAVHVMDNRPRLSPEILEWVRTLGPVALLVLILTAARTGTIVFKGAEIQFLFPAPIGRRELILYDALSKLRLQLLSGLWVSFFLLRFAELWYAAVVAAVLALAVMQLSGQAIGLLLTALGCRFGKGVRRGALFGTWAVVVATALVAYTGAPEGDGMMAVAERFAASPPIALLAWLARPPIEVFLATSASAFVMWTAVAVGELLVLLGVAMVCDTAYTETALHRSQKVAENLARVRSGGFAFARSGSARSLRIPQLPHLGGAGPIAWRQLQELSRNYRGALMLGVVPILTVILMHWMLGATAQRDGAGMPVEAIMVALLVMMPLITMNVAFDFRRDLDRLALLKALPISPFALSAGQISTTALLLCVWQLLAVVALSIAIGPISTPFLVGFLLLFVPLNIVLTALDNVLFLLMPYRLVAKDPGRMPFMGRVMVVMFLKMLLIFALAALMAIPVALAWAFGVRSAVEVATTAALSLAVFAVLMIYAVAKAFKAFDVTRDVPD